MKISTFLYTMRQGFVNLFRNKWYSLASIATIAACLFLFGIFYAIVANFQHIVKGVQEGVSITVFFDEGLSEEKMHEIGALIEAREEVAEMNFISAEQAWEEFQDDYFGDRKEEFLAGYPDNPLANDANYEVFLNDVSKQADLITFIESIQGVRDINASVVTADTLSGINRLISYVSIAIIAILLGVSVFLIGNTVTIGISIRKEEINIMKYVGATDFFVRAPFIIEGMLIGLVGAAIPLVLIYQAYDELINYVMDKFAVLVRLLDFMSVDQIFEVLTPVCLLVGVGIGFIGSYTTVRKHLHV